MAPNTASSSRKGSSHLETNEGPMALTGQQQCMPLMNLHDQKMPRLMASNCIRSRVEIADRHLHTLARLFRPVSLVRRSGGGT